MTRFASGGYIFSEGEPTSCPDEDPIGEHAFGCPCPVGGDIVYAPAVGANGRPIVPGNDVVVVNAMSMWYGLSGRVERIHDWRGEKTLHVRVNRCEIALPFGASEVAGHGA